MITHLFNKLKTISHNIYVHKPTVIGLCTLLLIISLALTTELDVNAAKDRNTKIVKKNNDFKVSAEYGIGGFIEYEHTMQATVTIESSKDFTGILQIVGDTDSGEVVTAYGKRISIAAGESKTYRLAVKPPTSSGIVRLIILNEKEKPVYEEKTTVEMTGTGQNSLLGVLSDDYSGVGYINGVSYNISGSTDYQAISTMEFNKDSFPEDAQILDIMNYLVIDNFDTSTLSKKQYDALKQWVADGGILILSLGSHYQNVLSAFNDDFVSGTLGDIGKRNLTWSNNEKDYSLNDVECIDFNLNDGIEMSVHTSDKTAWKKSYGLGEVVVLSYSISMEPFSSWHERKDVAAMLIGEINENSSSSVARANFSSMFGTLLGLASISENTKRPSTILYGILLSIYVVFVGPILYLILKKKKVREKIWYFIPVVSLVFTGIIYCTSFIYRVNKPLFNSFTLIQASDGGAKETVYSEVVCPSAKRYDFKINENYNGFKNEFYQYDYGLFGNSKSKDGQYDTMYLDNGTDSEIILNSDSAFDKFDFAMSRVLDEGVGDFTLDIECDWNGISGKITNNTAYDLRDVVLTYESMIFQAGDMKKGETVEIDSSKIVTSSGYGTFDIVNVSSNSPDKERLYRIDNALEEVIDISNYNHGYVWGTVESYKSEMISDSQVKSSGMAVIINSYYHEKVNGSGNAYSSIVPMIVDSQGDYDSGTGSLYGNDATITYSFEGYGEIDTLTPVLEVGYGEENNTYFASCEAMNVDTGQFEPVFVDGAELSGEELKKYLSHGVLILRFSKPNGDGYQEYLIPRIAAFGK